MLKRTKKLLDSSFGVGRFKDLIDFRSFGKSLSTEQMKPIVERLKTISNNKLTKAVEPTCYQSNNQEAEHFVKMWCSRLADAPPTVISFKNEEFCQLFLDQALPLSWHFDNDIVVVISPPSTDIVNILKIRGQKNIVIYFFYKIFCVFR